MKLNWLFVSCLVLSACGGGGDSEQPATPPVVSNPSQGTVLEESCDGTTLIQTIADGNGGSTEQETENSEKCGYVAPPDAGTVLDEYCEGYTYITVTADGNGGSTTEETPNSEECGYEAPPVFGTPLSDPYCANSTEQQFIDLLNTVQNLSEFDKVRDFADGEGGSYTEVVETDSEDCGYVPPPEAGTALGDSYCAGSLTPEEYDPHWQNINHLLPEDRLQDYADGEGGTYTERTVHLDQSCFTQMEIPDECTTTRTDTGDSRYEYITCDGVKQRTPVSFPYMPREEHAGRAIIDMLIVFDTNITEEDRDGMTVEEFVDKQVFESNHMYMVSGTHTLVRVAGIKMVDVAAGDLYRQYSAFFNARYEFVGLDDWQKEAGADLAFLFKKRPEKPIACGVANIDATRGLSKTRGITQCFHNSVFQEYETTRYYERAHETFAHEIGHLLGAQHHYLDADQPGIFEYSFGHHLSGYNPQSDNPDYEGMYGGYGTIMSYADLPTGRFSDYTVECEIPETGQIVDLGTTGGCFCSDPIEERPQPTNNAETIARTRWIMSQLHEMEHGVQFSPIRADNKVDICLF